MSPYGEWEVPIGEREEVSMGELAEGRTKEETMERGARDRPRAELNG